MPNPIAIQCGHGVSLDGGWDAGCVYGKYSEAALMLKITKAAVKYLRANGFNVISDADNGNNKNMIADVRWANQAGARIYISIHCDYSKAPSGVMPLYVSSSGKKLAKCLNKAVKSDLKMRSRGVQKRTDLWELNGTDMTACILETGAIKADLKTLRDKPDAYGKAIAKGVCAYLGVKFKDPSKPKNPNPIKKKPIYRVRKSWKDADSQKGAFNDLDNAKACAKKYKMHVYDSKGKKVY